MIQYFCGWYLVFTKGYHVTPMFRLTTRDISNLRETCRLEEFKKRLANLVQKTKAGKQFGHSAWDFPPSKAGLTWRFLEWRRAMGKGTERRWSWILNADWKKKIWWNLMHIGVPALWNQSGRSFSEPLRQWHWQVLLTLWPWCLSVSPVDTAVCNGRCWVHWKSGGFNQMRKDAGCWCKLKLIMITGIMFSESSETREYMHACQSSGKRKIICHSVGRALLGTKSTRSAVTKISYSVSDGSPTKNGIFQRFLSKRTNLIF